MLKTEKTTLVVHRINAMTKNAPLLEAEPLWKRVPTRDSAGKLYNDFMMYIPGLRNFEVGRLHSIVNKIEKVLNGYQKNIVLADLNLKLNILWVTIKPDNGLTVEIASLIHHVVPEAKLVAQHRAYI